MKTHLILSVAILFLSLQSQAQSISPEVIGSSGEHSTSATAQLSWTVGEVMIDTYQNNIIITQGFHQPEEKDNGLTEIPTISMSVYPNPTQDQLIISFESNPMGYTCQLYSTDGKLLVEKIIVQGDLESTLDISALPVAQYMLKISNSSGSQYSNYQIQKIH